MFYCVGSFSLEFRSNFLNEKWELEEFRVWLLHHCNKVEFQTLWEEKYSKLPHWVQKILKGDTLSDEEMTNISPKKIDTFFRNLTSYLDDPQQNPAHTKTSSCT